MYGEKTSLDAPITANFDYKIYILLINQILEQMIKSHSLMYLNDTAYNMNNIKSTFSWSFPVTLKAHFCLSNVVGCE